MIKTYSDVQIHEGRFQLVECSVKPRGGALETLNRIEQVIRQQLTYDPVQTSELSKVSSDEVYRTLQGKAKSIRDGYLTKASRISFVRRFFGGVARKEEVIRNKCRCIFSECVEFQKTFASIGLCPDVENCIFSFFRITDFARVALVNHNASTLVQQAIIERAHTFGYKGEQFPAAREHLQMFLTRMCWWVMEKKGRLVACRNRELGREATLMKVRKVVVKTQDNQIIWTMNQSLHFFIKHDNYWSVKLILWLGISPDAPCPKDDTSPLSTAAALGRAAIAQMLIEAGANVNAIGPQGGNWALCRAIESYHTNTEMVSLLLNNGADQAINRVDNHGKTPLALGIEKGCDNKLLTLLIDRGATV